MTDTVTPPPAIYKDDDLVYVDPERKVVVGLVEFTENGKAKALPMKGKEEEVDEEEISDINDNEEDEKIDEEDNDKNEVESESNFIDERRPVCTQEWRPVCGKDGKTYPNACTAKSVNKEIAHLGVCQTPQNLLEKLYQPFINR